MTVNIAVIAFEKIASLAAVLVLPHPRATTDNSIGLPDVAAVPLVL
jgi:hypothetical protein